MLRFLCLSEGNKVPVLCGSPDGKKRRWWDGVRRLHEVRGRGPYPQVGSMRHVAPGPRGRVPCWWPRGTPFGLAC